MTHRGPFQPLLFCDSVILCDKINPVRLKKRKPSLMLSVPILLFKINQWPEMWINSFALAQDSTAH